MEAIPKPRRAADGDIVRRQQRLLLASTTLIVALGLAAELGEYVFDAPSGWVEQFSLSYEANVPTWYATILLFRCAQALVPIARTATRCRAHWWGLAAGFGLMSLDEAVELHEHLVVVMHGVSLPRVGVLYFAWVVPAAVLVTGLALAYVPFLRTLPAEDRRRFLIAGIVYVGGAVGMELPLGHWTAHHGDDNLGYGLIDLAEETLELAGIGMFLVALARRTSRQRRLDAAGAPRRERGTA